MNLGISLCDIVKLPDGSYGQVIGINDWSDRHPADLQILVAEDGLPFPDGIAVLVKYRADEVTRILHENH